MRFLADESCDHAVVRAYEAAGHDVVILQKAELGSSDHYVLSMAAEQDRILLTEDKDFGKLIYWAGLPSSGVILFRFPQATRHLLADMALDLLDSHADQLMGSFVVVGPGWVRFGTQT